MSDQIKDLCCDVDVESMVNQPIALVPSVKSSALRMQLPASPAQAALFNGGPISLFSQTNGNAAANGFVSGDVAISTFFCAFLIRGFAIRLASGPRALAIAGYAVAAPAAGASAGCVPAIPGPPGPGDAWFNATLNANQDAAEALFWFAEAYRLEVLLACFYQLFDERVADFGTISADCMCGFGTAQSEVQTLIAEANDRALEIGSPFQFILPMSSGGGCCGVGTPTPLGAHLAPVQWLGTDFEGAYGGVYPVPTCLVITPGQPFQMRLTLDDNADYALKKLQKLISAPTEQTIGAAWTNQLCVTTPIVTLPFGGTVGGTVIAPAGTLPAGTFTVSATGVVTLAVAGSIVPAFGSAPIAVAAGTTLAAAGVPPTAAIVGSTSTAIGKSSTIPMKTGYITIEIDILGYDLEPEEAIYFFSMYSGLFSPLIRSMYMSSSSGWIGNQLGVIGTKVAGLNPGIGVAGLLQVGAEKAPQAAQ
jgi:hypothetical protein